MPHTEHSVHASVHLLQTTIRRIHSAELTNVTTNTTIFLGPSDVTNRPCTALLITSKSRTFSPSCSCSLWYDLSDFDGWVEFAKIWKVEAMEKYFLALHAKFYAYVCVYTSVRNVCVRACVHLSATSQLAPPQSICTCITMPPNRQPD